MIKYKTLRCNAEDTWYGITIELPYCESCGLLVGDEEIHNTFHENMERIADDAYWGGLNRPIG